jgi:hypothetical protein
MFHTIRAFALGAALSLLAAAPGLAQQQAPAITAQTLIDRAEITDLLTRYYYSLGKASADSFGAFYTEDAELVLGSSTFKGRAGIEGAYRGTGDSPQRRAYAFNILLSNPLITVRGDTATAQIIFTELLIEKQGEKPHVHTQGREYDTLVKVNGQWRFKRRQIMPGTQAPAGWTN